MTPQAEGDTALPDLPTVVREWGRIGCLGFGGPPAHIVMLRELCVDRRRWLTADDFEDAIATTNLLPGPGSTQLAIFCGWRVAGVPGALAGGLAFIVPGLILIIALAALFLAQAPPSWVRGAGAGAGAAVAAVAVQAGSTLLAPGWARVRSAGPVRTRWILYLVAGATAAAAAGPWTVVVLLGCGAAELSLAAGRGGHGAAGGGPSAAPDGPRLHAWPVLLALLAAATAGGGLAALAWVAFKVGALSYGGGFVIIPLMQADAVGHHHWLTDAQFTSGVALGQVTPGPVVHTVAVVGYAARGVGGALLAAAVAFAPSFAFILLGGARFDRLRADARVRRFLAGAGPAAIGAILGSAIPLALALTEWWQAAVLAAAATGLFVLRRGVVVTLVLAGAIGALVGIAGGPLPG